MHVGRLIDKVAEPEIRRLVVGRAPQRQTGSFLKIRYDSEASVVRVIAKAIGMEQIQIQFISTGLGRVRSRKHIHG